MRQKGFTTQDATTTVGNDYYKICLVKPAGEELKHWLTWYRAALHEITGSHYTMILSSCDHTDYICLYK